MLFLIPEPTGLKFYLEISLWLGNVWWNEIGTFNLV